jgi:hypothetical protein
MLGFAPPPAAIGKQIPPSTAGKQKAGPEGPAKCDVWHALRYRGAEMPSGIWARSSSMPACS